MQESPLEAHAEHFPLRRSLLALAALRAALRDLQSRSEQHDDGLMGLALMRLETLRTELEQLETQAKFTAICAAPQLTLDELCQAAQQSLPVALHDRVLIAVERSSRQPVVDGERASQCVRRLMAAMFSCGAEAILLHGHVEGEEAVFAILDDRHIFDPTGVEGAHYAAACREIQDMHGCVAPIGTPGEQQGVIVRFPVSVGTDTRRPAASVTCTTGVLR